MESCTARDAYNQVVVWIGRGAAGEGANFVDGNGKIIMITEICQTLLSNYFVNLDLNGVSGQEEVMGGSLVMVVMPLLSGSTPSGPSGPSEDSSWARLAAHSSAVRNRPPGPLGRLMACLCRDSWRYGFLARAALIDSSNLARAWRRFSIL